MSTAHAPEGVRTGGGSTRADIAQARSFLFVPGNRPERFEKAARSGADAVILDLEDSVPLQDKTLARQAIAAHWHPLCGLGVPLVVRINPDTSDAWRDDLALLVSLPGLAGVMLSKAESALVLRHLHELLPGASLLPLIESASGWHALENIARSPGVARLVVGHIDFMADTGMSCSADESNENDEAELAPLRFAVAMHTRLASLAPAVDGVTVQTNDAQRLQADTLRARRFGFGGKLCIHPHQIAAVHAALAPSEQELVWAARVLEADAAAGGAAVQLDGRMVDTPVVLQARRTLQRAATRR